MDLADFIFIQFNGHFLSRRIRYSDELLGFYLLTGVTAVSALIQFSVIFAVARFLLELQFGKSWEVAPNQDKGLF